MGGASSCSMHARNVGGRDAPNPYEASVACATVPGDAARPRQIHRRPRIRRHPDSYGKPDCNGEADRWGCRGRRHPERVRTLCAVGRIHVRHAARRPGRARHPLPAPDCAEHEGTRLEGQPADGVGRAGGAVLAVGLPSLAELHLRQPQPGHAPVPGGLRRVALFRLAVLAGLPGRGRQVPVRQHRHGDGQRHRRRRGTAAG